MGRGHPGDQKPDKLLVVDPEKRREDKPKANVTHFLLQYKPNLGYVVYRLVYSEAELTDEEKEAILSMPRIPIE